MQVNQSSRDFKFSIDRSNSPVWEKQGKLSDGFNATSNTHGETMEEQVATVLHVLFVHIQ